MTPATRPRSRRCEMRWVRRNLALPGPREPKCRPRKRSLTARPRPTQAAQQRLGIADPGRTRCRPAGQGRPRQQRHRRTALCLPTYLPGPPHPRLHQTRADLPRAAGARGSPARLTRRVAAQIKDVRQCPRRTRGRSDASSEEYRTKWNTSTPPAFRAELHARQPFRSISDRVRTGDLILV